METVLSRLDKKVYFLNLFRISAKSYNKSKVICQSIHAAYLLRLENIIVNT